MSALQDFVVLIVATVYSCCCEVRDHFTIVTFTCRACIILYMCIYTGIHKFPRSTIAKLSCKIILFRSVELARSMRLNTMLIWLTV